MCGEQRHKMQDIGESTEGFQIVQIPDLAGFNYLM